MKRIKIVSIILITFLLFGFKINNNLKINRGVKSNVYLLNPERFANYNLRSDIWTSNFLIATFPKTFIKISADFKVVYDSIIGDLNLLTTYPFTMNLNRLRN